MLVNDSCFPAGAAVGDSGYNTPVSRSMLTRAIMLALVALIIIGFSAPWASSEEDDNRIPAYHSAAPALGTKLAPILGREQLWGNNDQFPFQSKAYELAAKVPDVLYQQPCYCYCDRLGHKSLHSCFESTHGAQCSTCMKEVFYAYQMTKQHKTAAQIRKGIIAGEWKKIDLQQASSTN